jgi:hypothetical protein
MGYRPEAVERIDLRHSSGFAAELRTGCSCPQVLRILPVRRKDWYLGMVELRHWREGGMMPAGEQKHLYIISMTLGLCSQDVSYP